MDPCPSVWNLLHDGIIAGISGGLPGTLVLEVDIGYLRRRFSAPGDKIVLRLLGCVHFRYMPWSTSDPVTELSQIAAKELEILGADQGESFCVVHCSAFRDGGGVLEVFSEQVELALDNGRVIALDELEREADAYWTEWESGRSA